MKIVTVSEMVEIEKASDAAGHSYDVMMELAGRAVAAAVIRHMSPWDSNGDVLVLVGPGNNGGDGLVAARYLHRWEPSRELAVYCWKRDPKDDSNYDAVRRLKIPILHAEEDPSFERLQELVDNGYCESIEDCRWREGINNLVRFHYSYEVHFTRRP